MVGREWTGHEGVGSMGGMYPPNVPVGAMETIAALSSLGTSNLHILAENPVCPEPDSDEG